MPATDIIFNIGTVGAEATAGAIKGIITNFNSLRKVVMEAVDSAQRYQQVVNGLDVDMRKFNGATKGQIDTLESYQVANKLTAAGVNVTAERMETLGKAAVFMNKKIGGGPGGATREFAKLASGIIRARESALIPFNVDLSQTVDKAKAQEESFQQLTDIYSEYEVVLETTAERQFMVANTLGTIKDQLAVAAWDRFATGANDTGVAIWDLVGALDQFSTDMKDTEGRLASWIVTNDGLTHSFNVMINTIGATITPFDKFNKNLEVLDHNYGKIVTKMRIVNNMMGGLDFEKLAMGMGLDPKAKIKKTTLEPGKVGGKKKDRADDFIISEEEAQFGMTQDELDFWRKNAEATQEQIEAEFFNAFSNGDIDVQDHLLDMKMARFKVESDAAFAHAEMMMEVERLQTEHQEQQAQARIDNTIRTAGATSGILGNLQKTMDKNSEGGFNAAKNLAMAQVAVDTPAAAMAAYKSVVGIPYVGPILAVIAAGTAVAAGMAQMAQIKRQKFGKSGGSSSVSAASVSAPSISGTANDYGAGATQGQGNNVTNNILVDGQLIHSSMINANNNAAMRNEEHFTTVE